MRTLSVGRPGHSSSRSANAARPRNLYIREDHALARLTHMNADLGPDRCTPEDLADQLRAHQQVITTDGITWNVEPAKNQPTPNPKEAHPRQTQMTFVG